MSINLKNFVFGPFLVHFPNFGENFFFHKIQLSCTTSYGFLAPCQKLEKTNDTILRERLGRQKDRRTKGQKDRQTLFHRTLLATGRGPKRLDYTDMSIIFQSIMIVLMLLIFWIFVNIWWKTWYQMFGFIKNCWIMKCLSSILIQGIRTLFSWILKRKKKHKPNS